MSATRLIVTAILLAVCPAPAAEAQSAPSTVEWQIGSRTYQVGEPFELRLVCTNLDRPQPPQIPAIDGLEIQLLSPAPQHFSSTSIAHGRVSKETTDTYIYRALGGTAGEFTIPAVDVPARGKSLKTTPLAVRIVPAPEESDNLGDRYLYASLVVDAESVYVTETVTATLRLGIRKLTVNGREADVDLWRNVASSGTASLSVFAGVEPSVTTAAMIDSNGDRHTYQVYRFDATIRADEAGPMLIGPVFVAWNYPTEVRARRDFFSMAGQRLEVVRSQHTRTQADAVTINVKAPPTEGQPRSYNGAIGRYKLDVDVKPDTVELGQPVTLNVTVRGRPLDGVAGPDLTRQPDLVSRFDFRRDEIVGELSDGSKTFRQAIFPKQEGRQTIPPIEWSYFDTRSEQYVTLTSDPLSLNVLPSKAAPSQMLLLDAPDARKNGGESLTLVHGGGLSPNYVDPALVLASHPFVLGWPAAATLIAPPLLLAALVVTRRKHIRLKSDDAYRRRRHARRNAIARLTEAAARVHAQAQAVGVADALRGFIADRFNLPSGALTAEDARRTLAEAGLAPALVGEITAFLDACDAAQYAGGAGIASTRASDDPGAAGASRASGFGSDNARRVREWMTQIEAATQ